MAAWFARHDESEAEYDEDEVDHPANDSGWTARKLWGGDPGERWASRTAEKIRRFRDESDRGDHDSYVDPVLDTYRPEVRAQARLHANR